MPLKSPQTILFVFSRLYDRWWAKYLSGFNHMAMAIVLDKDYVIVIEPWYSHCSVTCRTYPAPGEWDKWKVVELTVVPTNKQKLVRPVMQTCATLCQYLGGVNLGCILPNSLYNTIVSRSAEWLKDKGIQGVKIWEPQQCQ